MALSTLTCQECGAQFDEAPCDECPECGSPDVDVTTPPAPVKAKRGGSRNTARLAGDYAGAFDGFTVTSDADMGL